MSHRGGTEDVASGTREGTRGARAALARGRLRGREVPAGEARKVLQPCGVGRMMVHSRGGPRGGKAVDAVVGLDAGGDYAGRSGRTTRGISSQKAAGVVPRHRHRIPNCCRHKVPLGMVEAMNWNIRVVIRPGRGCPKGEQRNSPDARRCPRHNEFFVRPLSSRFRVSRACSLASSERTLPQPSPQEEP